MWHVHIFKTNKNGEKEIKFTKYGLQLLVLQSMADLSTGWVRAKYFFLS